VTHITEFATHMMRFTTLVIKFVTSVGVVYIFVGERFYKQKLDCWLYHDASLDGQQFVNGKQAPLRPGSAGPRFGSVPLCVAAC